MENVKSIGALLGVAEPESGEGGKEARVAAQNVWLSDLKGAPEWLVRKYFTNENGATCGRMRVKGFDRIGDVLVENGQVVRNRWGKPKKLTTGYLAKRVEEDLAEAGFPGMRIHFKGYDLDPERFAMANAFLQEDYEENEARHVPGLDEDEAYEPANPQTPLDRETWDALACFMMNALRAHTLMCWGVEEDFAKVLSATDFVHVAYNAYLKGLWARLCGMTTPETLTFVSEHNDFKAFDVKDVIRAYSKAMRFLTGKECGENMYADAWILDPDLDAACLNDCATAIGMGVLTPSSDGLDERQIAALVLANADPTDEVTEWDYEASNDENMFDDDSGELTEGLLLRY